MHRVLVFVEDLQNQDEQILAAYAEKHKIKVCELGPRLVAAKQKGDHYKALTQDFDIVLFTLPACKVVTRVPQLGRAAIMNLGKEMCRWDKPEELPKIVEQHRNAFNVSRTRRMIKQSFDASSSQAEVSLLMSRWEECLNELKQSMSANST